MASSKSILVTNLPIPQGCASLEDKLEIHFSRRSNGGGDVDSIEIERLPGTSQTCAVITFAEEKTVSAVIKKQHKLCGARLRIKPHPRPTLETAPKDRTTSRKKMTITTASNNSSEIMSSQKHLCNSSSAISAQNVKLVVNEAYSPGLLAYVTIATKTELNIDDKQARFTLTGQVSDVVQAASEVSRLNDGLKGHDSRQDDGLIPQDEKSENAGRTAQLKTSFVVESACGDQDNCNLPKQKTVCNNVFVPGSKLQKSKSATFKNQPMKNLILNFDQKVLDYVNLHVANHKPIQEIQDKYMVHFESKPNGVVKVTPKVPRTGHQNIMDAVGALEGLVNQTEKLGLVTKIVDLREFHEASQETLDAALERALASTQALVTRKTWNRLEVFGTQTEVDEEIAKLRESTLSEESSDKEDYSENNAMFGREENQNMAKESNMHAGHDRLEKEESTSDFAQELSYPLAFTNKDLKHIAGSNKFIQAEAFCIPRGPKHSYFDPATITFDGSDETDASVYLQNSDRSCERMEVLENRPECSLLPLENPTQDTDFLELDCPGHWNDDSAKCFAKQGKCNEEVFTTGNFEVMETQKRNDDQLAMERDSLGSTPQVSFFYIPPDTRDVEARAAAEYTSEDIKLCDLVENSPSDPELEDDDQLEQASSEPCPLQVSHIYFPPDTNDVDASAAASSEDDRLFSESLQNFTLGPVLGEAYLDAYVGTVSRSPVSTDHKNPLHEDIVPPDIDDLDQFGEVCRETALNGPSPRRAVSCTGGILPNDVTDKSEPAALYQVPVSNELANICHRSFDRGDFTVTLKTGTTLIIRHGDITNEFTDIIVASSDPRLSLQAGIGHRVREAAGPELVSACQHWIERHGPVQEGKSVWTTAGNLTCSHVLHVVPPRNKLSGLSNLEVLKTFYVEILKTCTRTLGASRISMPAIGAVGLASKKECAHAFCDAVLEITQLHGEGWVLLDRLVLVDTNLATVAQFQEVFTDAILSGYLQQFVSLKDAGPDNGTSEHPVNEFPSASVQEGRQTRPNNYKRRIRKSNPKLWPGDKKPGNGRVFDSEECSIPPPEKQCAICLGVIVCEKKLKCGHKFCRKCVDMATKVRKYCPLCRQLL